MLDTIQEALYRDQDLEVREDPAFSREHLGVSQEDLGASRLRPLQGWVGREAVQSVHLSPRLRPLYLRSLSPRPLP